MTFAFHSKILAYLALSFCISFSMVNASDIEEEKSSLLKFINAFGSVSVSKETPSLEKTLEFSEWQATFEKAKQEAAQKYGYLQDLREGDTKSYFEKIEAHQTSLAETAKFLTTTKIKELASRTENKAKDMFVDSATIFIVLSKFHEKTFEYLPKRHKLLSQSYVGFSRYEETDQLKQLGELFKTINPLMAKFVAEPDLYQNSDALKEISTPIRVAQQLIDELSKAKLKKRKDSSLACVSPRSPGSSKPEKSKEDEKDKETSPRSKTVSSPSSSAEATTDPLRAFSKEIAVKAQHVAFERQNSTISKSVNNGKSDN
ncbi:MAG: hypothetical protein BGO76_06110 [Caedibacter sp. 38-128]|nr:hypothetical protein [Holosporales bacterium]OJX08820.1 MAG: hypothetical protein BGO76_06110 [Caedibacter sp. 38-128]